MGRGRSRSRVAAAAKSAAEARPVAPSDSASSVASDDAETERADALREAVARGGPRGPGSGGKGRSRLEREQLTNWPVPAGHERKISGKIRASLAKKRRRQARTGGARTRGPAKAKAAKQPDAENLSL